MAPRAWPQHEATATKQTSDRRGHSFISIVSGCVTWFLQKRGGQTGEQTCFTVGRSLLWKKSCLTSWTLLIGNSAATPAAAHNHRLSDIDPAGSFSHQQCLDGVKGCRRGGPDTQQNSVNYSPARDEVKFCHSRFFPLSCQEPQSCESENLPISAHAAQLLLRTQVVSDQSYILIS